MDKLRVCLYLDDTRTATTPLPNSHPWEVVRNYSEYVSWIDKNGLPDFISFDHDLGKEHMDDYFRQILEKGYQHPDYDSYVEKTGLDCARYVVDYCQKHNVPFPSCSVHSHNPVGAMNIHDFINGFKRFTDQPEDCYLGRHPFEVAKV